METRNIGSDSDATITPLDWKRAKASIAQRIQRSLVATVDGRVCTIVLEKTSGTMKKPIPQAKRASIQAGTDPDPAYEADIEAATFRKRRQRRDYKTEKADAYTDAIIGKARHRQDLRRCIKRYNHPRTGHEVVEEANCPLCRLRERHDTRLATIDAEWYDA